MKCRLGADSRQADLEQRVEPRSRVVDPIGVTWLSHSIHAALRYRSVTCCLQC